MATITNATLTISHNHTSKTGKVIAKCNVNFTAFEINQMKQGLQFKLICQLWGADSGLNGADDFLYTMPTVKYFPDANSTATESVTFEATVGEGVLNEDTGTDEVYAKLKLTNLYTLVTVSKNTNEVSHSF